MAKNGMVLGGKYKKGSIILKDGTVVDAKALMEAKKAGIPMHELNAYLKAKAEQMEQKPIPEWATVSTEEIQQAVTRKEPWYKKFFKKGRK